MSDPRFARLKTDPRFRRPKQKQNTVVVDERFKSIFEDEASAKPKARVDKYGRKVSKTRDRDNLRKYYRLEEDEQDDEEGAPAAPDYARGEGLVESSDEDEDVRNVSGGSEDDEEPVTFGLNVKERKGTKANEDDFPEIDLDETNFEDLDRQASAYAKKYADEETPGASPSSGKATSRLAVVNLDWDHVKASHLFKIFDSVVSTGANGRARVLSVRVYPSQFGKERMAKEEIEGPPTELFRSKGAIAEEDMDEEDVNEETIFETGDDSHVNNDALRKYQLERLRYYYAIVKFDSAESASVAYSELDGTELERSANLFDLSYVPEGMDFDDEPRDEATHDQGVNSGLDFVTDALRHSKVKLTWDDDDTARVKVTRKAMSKKEMELQDYRAYIASSGSSSEESDGDAFDVDPVDQPSATAEGASTSTAAPPPKKSARQSREERRAKLREMLLDKDELPEGWGNVDGDRTNSAAKKGDLDVTFAPGLSTRAAAEIDQENENETTLERYQRRQKEKKAARKAAKEAKEAAVAAKNPSASSKAKSAAADGADDASVPVVAEDDFFGADSGDDEPAASRAKKNDKRAAKGKEAASPPPAVSDEPSTKEELALLLAPENAANGPKHFDMKEVLRAEKGAKKGKDRFKKKKNKGTAEPIDTANAEDGAGFNIDVADSRFSALHEEPEYAIDPSHPQFKATKSMTALVQERSKRQKQKHKADGNCNGSESMSGTARNNGASLGLGGGDIASLVESVKRKSNFVADVGKRDTKRRKV